MTNDISAGIGRNAAPQYDYDFTQEYLLKLRGADHIPLRKKSDYQIKENNIHLSNYVSPLMQSLNKSRRPGNK
ncbi:hypothetical protein [Pantoea stewartii]|uniref:hypothetical protein n=1 Tax=Pantoea stewartii TaxID=66269 RepID=UPI0002FAEC2A|nr:hypothetical protein [Pantoea stewartii]KAB0554015.1 hypothetical protein F7Q90_12560 [Pantoea stewartii subsp. stewartii]